MEITTGSPEWDDVEDRQIWQQFLVTQTGKRLIPKILDSCPTLLAKGELNEILIRSGEVRGVGFIVQALFALAIGEPAVVLPQTASAYPPLDDDSKWEDGQKINP